MKKGKLLVIDGADGTGKATQARLLVESLKSAGHQVEIIDFPRYKDNFAGKLIGEFQTDESFEFSKLHPILASLPYAIDRFESKAQIQSWLNEGKHVVCDRYVSANQLHQGGKIKNEEERKAFLEKLDHLEHTIFGIPRPDLVVLLDLPHEISLRLLAEKGATAKKDYSGNKMDRVENDAEYQINARESGIKMLVDKTWRRIECSEDGETILSPEIIHQRVVNVCMEILK